MPQANDAEIVRVYTRAFNGGIEDRAPDLTVGGNRFEVIVEAAAGSTRDNDGSPYTVSITALDITAGQSAAVLAPPMNPPTLSQTFRTNSASLPPVPPGASNISAWPGYEEKFVISLTAAEAALVVGHVFQYTAVLQATGDPIISITQSPPFTLVAS